MAKSNGKSFLTGSEQNQIACCLGRSCSVADSKNQNQNSSSKLHASCFTYYSALYFKEMMKRSFCLSLCRLEG